MTLRRRVAVASLAISLLGLAGCSEIAPEGGFGLPTLSDADVRSVASARGTALTISAGTLRVESNGCFTFEDAEATDGRRAWIVWPDTAHQDGDEVVLGSGARLGSGDDLSGTATAVDLSDLPDGSSASSYFGSFGRFCDADTRGVIVFADIGS